MFLVTNVSVRCLLPVFQLVADVYANCEEDTGKMALMMSPSSNVWVLIIIIKISRPKRNPLCSPKPVASLPITTRLIKHLNRPSIGPKRNRALNPSLQPPVSANVDASATKKKTHLNLLRRRRTLPAQHIQRTPLLRLHNRPVDGVVLHDVVGPGTRWGRGPRERDDEGTACAVGARHGRRGAYDRDGLRAGACRVCHEDGAVGLVGC
jgi:hypothetical protein